MGLVRRTAAPGWVVSSAPTDRDATFDLHRFFYLTESGVDS